MIQLNRGVAIQLTLLALAIFAGGYAALIVSPLQEALRLAHGYSDNQMAFVQGPARALPVLIAGVPIGLLIDRWIRVRLLFLLIALTVVGNVVTAYAPTFAWFFAARCFIGFAAAAIGTTSFSLLADLFPPAQRGRATMVIGFASVAGNAAAFGLGGLALSLAGVSAAALQATLLWLTLPLIPALLAAVAMREPERIGVVNEKPSLRVLAGEIWRWRGSIGPTLIGLILVQIAVVAALVWAAPVLTRTYGLSASWVGGAMAGIVLGAGILGPLVGGVVADRCQQRQGPAGTAAFLAVATLLAAALGMFALLPDEITMLSALFLFMTVVTAVHIAGIALFTILAPNEIRGVCMMMLTSAELLLGVAVAPVLVSISAGFFTGEGAIAIGLAITCSAATLAAAVVFAMDGRRMRARDRAAPLPGDDVYPSAEFTA